MALRRTIIVGDEQAVRSNLRLLIAARRKQLAGDKPKLLDEPFDVDLMDVSPYPELRDQSREAMLNGIVGGYHGASTEVDGIRVPNYTFTVLDRPHHIRVSYEEDQSGPVDRRVDSPASL